VRHHAGKGDVTATQKEKVRDRKTDPKVMGGVGED
jgi:hypothetical protein